jgi:PAS domain S-box-containing protein
VDSAFTDCAGSDATVGTADADGHIDRISRDVEALLGYPNVHFVGTGLISLAHPVDAQRLQEAIDRAVTERGSVELRMLAPRADGTRREVRMFLSAEPDESPTRLGFTLAGVAEGGRTIEQRAADLEATLRRIADEMQTVGITAGMAHLPPAARLPELADLSTRQWEIVTRLQRGDRVPAIAKAMFLSAHTVRNHLSAVYKKLGIHSQQELIERLREEPGRSV